MSNKLHLAKSNLAVQFGFWNSKGKLKYSKAVVAVESVLEAPAIFQRLRDQNNWRSDETPVCVVVDTSNGEQVAKVSFNGRLWDTKGNEIQQEGIKTCKEHDADGWADFIMTSAPREPVIEGEFSCAS